MPFVQNLFSGSSKATGPSVILSGSKTVSAGNTIFVAVGSTNTGETVTVTDNLGNSYSMVKAGATSNALSRLYRADVTNPGTLTTITVTQSPSWNILAAIAVEFSAVGTVRFTGESLGGSSAVANAYPGGNNSSGSSYIASDLWIGAFAQNSQNTFAVETGGIALPALEPTPEARTTGGGSNIAVGLLYYISAAPQSGVGILGRYSGATSIMAVGAAIEPKISGPTYNDARSGTIVVTGTRTESWVRRFIFTDAPAGAVALAGSVVESQVVRITYNDAPTGAIASYRQRR